MDVRQLSIEEIQAKYDRFARWYNVVEAIPDWLLIRRRRKKLLARAHGEVLEIGAGTGRNISFYRNASRIILLDLSQRMLEQAITKAGRSLKVPWMAVQGDAQRLPFLADSFDTVISSLSLCTFPQPEVVLAEMMRVCRPGGTILLLEHGIAENQTLAAWQRRYAPSHFRRFACQLDRDHEELVRRSGLKILSYDRALGGMLYEFVLENHKG